MDDTRDAATGAGTPFTAAGVRWDLASLYASPRDPSLTADIDAAHARGVAFAAKYRGRLTAHDLEAETLRGAVREYEAIQELGARPGHYASLLAAADSQDPVALDLEQRTHEAHARLRTVLIFFEIELANLDDARFETLVEHPALGTYRHWLRTIRRFKPHVLSEPEERTLARKDVSGRTAFVQLYDELTGSLRFQVTIDGEPRELTDGEVMALLHHSDRERRRAALEAYLRRYADERLPLTAILNALLLDHRIECEMRGYEDLAAPTHLSNDVDAEVVAAMMDSVGRHYPVIQDYLRLKARLLGMPRLEISDVYAPLAAESPRIAYRDAQTIVLDAFGRFSGSFTDVARGFFTGPWIDAETRPGKRHGAFCAAFAPKHHPYVLMSYAGTGRDVATLAHEVGHGVHYVLASEQTMLDYDAPLVLAETASVFAEMLVTDHLVATTTDVRARRHLLVETLDEIYGTLFRQHALTRFELAAHEARRDHRLASEELCDVWERAQRDLFADTVDIPSEYRFGWSYIPHFVHSRFYCYAYAFGELLTLALFDRYREQGAAFVPEYLRLLASGGSDDPASLLKRFGFDIRSPAFWDRGCQTVARMVAELADGL